MRKRKEKAPIEISRDGRFLAVKSNLTSEDLSELWKSLREGRDGMRDEITSRIGALRDYIGAHDPHSVLGPLAFRHLLVDPESYSEPSHLGRESHVEFALNLVGAVEYDLNGEKYPAADSERVAREIDEVFQHVAIFYMLEEPGGRTNEEQKLRVDSLLQSLNVRGSTYWEHEVETIRALFDGDDGFFEQHYGFSATFAIECFLQIERDLQTYLDQAIEAGRKAKEAHARFQAYVTSHDVDVMTMEEVFERALNDEDREALKNFVEKTQYPPFQLHSRADLPVEFLDRISFEPGDNTVFFEFEKAPGWPLGNSDIALRPVLRFGGEYHVYHPQLLLRQMSSIMQSWIRDSNEEYFEQNWKVRAARFLERQAEEHLLRAFPGGAYYSCAYYNFDCGDGRGKRRFETDGLFVYDDILIVVEAKSGFLSTSTRRGSPVRLRRDARELIGEAADQGDRVLRYLASNVEVEFVTEDGTSLVQLRQKDFRETFVINVTLDHLGHIATHLPVLAGC